MRKTRQEERRDERTANRLLAAATISVSGSIITLLAALISLLKG